jgi:TfoX/Sxy family transcriptional regulator of competence genes
MPTSKEYRDFIAEQLAGLEGARLRPMMGEYLLYYQGKLVGGLYDDRLLVKLTAGAEALLPGAPRELPYPGAKEMLLVENVDEREALQALLPALAAALPEGRKKTKKTEAADPAR